MLKIKLYITSFSLFADIKNQLFSFNFIEKINLFNEKFYEIIFEKVKEWLKSVKQSNPVEIEIILSSEVWFLYNHYTPRVSQKHKNQVINYEVGQILNSNEFDLEWRAISQVYQEFQIYSHILGIEKKYLEIIKTTGEEFGLHVKGIFCELDIWNYILKKDTPSLQKNIDHCFIFPHQIGSIAIIWHKDICLFKKLENSYNPSDSIELFFKKYSENCIIEFKKESIHIESLECHLCIVKEWNIPINLSASENIPPHPIHTFSIKDLLSNTKLLSNSINFIHNITHTPNNSPFHNRMINWLQYTVILISTILIVAYAYLYFNNKKTINKLQKEINIAKKEAVEFHHKETMLQAFNSHEKKIINLSLLQSQWVTVLNDFQSIFANPHTFYIESITQADNIPSKNTTVHYYKLSIIFENEGKEKFMDFLNTVESIFKKNSFLQYFSNYKIEPYKNNSLKILFILGFNQNINT